MSEVQGRISGANLVPIVDNHPVEWLRGRVVIEVVIDPADAKNIRIGGDILLDWDGVK